MTHKMPPIPPENRSPKGPGEPARRMDAGASGGQTKAANPDKVGQSGNSKVNTTHQGLQQDR
jgi:hypothetical protein